MHYILLIFLLGLTSAEPDFQVLENEMSEEMEEFAVAEALLLLRASHSSQMPYVAKNLANKMNTEYGKQWMCFVGKNFNDSGFEILHQNKSLISFAFKQTQFILFKPHLDTVNDPIIDARKDNAKVDIVFFDMEEKTKITVIDIAKIAIKNFNDYQSLSLNITQALQTSLGNEWRVVIVNNRFDGDQQLYTSISIPGSLMSFKIESIEFIIFRLGAFENKVKNFKLLDLFLKFTLNMR
jgi:hypothetical protein